MSEHIETMISAEAIASRVCEMGKEIAKDYQGRSPVFVCVLKGSFIFASDLVRMTDLPVRLDFLGVRSYGERTESSGVVQIIHDLSHPIADEDVLIVEDIVDTGLTISHLIELFRTRHPRSIKICTLLHKPSRARVEVKIDYKGFEIEDRFVVGYGMDFAEHYRNLPFVGILKRENPSS